MKVRELHFHTPEQKCTLCVKRQGRPSGEKRETGEESESPDVHLVRMRVCSRFPSIRAQTEREMNRDRDRPRSSLSSSPLWSRWTLRDLCAWLRFISCTAESHEGDTGDVMRTCERAREREKNLSFGSLFLQLRHRRLLPTHAFPIRVLEEWWE